MIVVRMPLSIIFQLFYWWRKPEYSGKKNTDLPEVTNKLLHKLVSNTLHHVQEPNSQTLSHNIVYSIRYHVWEFNLQTLEVKGTDGIGKYRSNYQTITI